MPLRRGDELSSFKPWDLISDKIDFYADVSLTYLLPEKPASLTGDSLSIAAICSSSEILLSPMTK